MRALLRLLAICLGARRPRGSRARLACFAEAPGPRTTPVHVLGIDSDDAEDQADALTGALRSRVRSAPGWSLQETQHALGMLTAALRCPQKPDAACLQRIGDQLHTDRFVWGVMSKVAGKPGHRRDSPVGARASPTPRQGDLQRQPARTRTTRRLRRIAARILDKHHRHHDDRHRHGPRGRRRRGRVDQRAEEASRSSTARRRSSSCPGRTTSRFARRGSPPRSKRGSSSPPGQDTSVALKLVAAPARPSAEPQAPGARPTCGASSGGSSSGSGVVGEIVAGVEGIDSSRAKSDLDNDRSAGPVQITRRLRQHGPAQFNAAATTACQKYNQAPRSDDRDRAVGERGAVALAPGRCCSSPIIEGDGGRERHPRRRARSAALPRAPLRRHSRHRRRREPGRHVSEHVVHPVAAGGLAGDPARERGARRSRRARGSRRGAMSSIRSPAPSK